MTAILQSIGISMAAAMMIASSAWAGLRPRASSTRAKAPGGFGSARGFLLREGEKIARRN